jgi:hypothetical protein
MRCGSWPRCISAFFMDGSPYGRWFRCFDFCLGRSKTYGDRMSLSIALALSVIAYLAITVLAGIAAYWLDNWFASHVKRGVKGGRQP